MTDEEAEEGGRVLRGSALYAQASLINHECNPNIARFDAFDQQGPGSTHVCFRAMHDLPPGEESCMHMSHVPKDVMGLEATSTPLCQWRTSRHSAQQTCHGPLGWHAHHTACAVSTPCPQGQEKSEYVVTCTLLLCFLFGIAGTEVFQSYCPLSWDYDERQAHCKEVYGFTCICQRCQMEGQLGRTGGGEGMQGDGNSSGEWMTDDDDEGREAGMVDEDNAPASSGADGGMAVDADAPGGGNGAGPLDPTYLQLYLLKFVCPVPSCFGTMAPVGPGVSLLECAVCGHTRSEEKFLQDLEGPASG